MRTAAAILLSVISLVLLGCGGGSSSTSGPDFVRGDLSRSNWIRHADPLCGSTREAIAPIRSRLGKALAQGNLPLAGVVERSIVYQLERNGERLRRLGVPTEGSKMVHEFARRLERKIELNIDLAEALEASEAAHAGRIQADLSQTGKSALALAHRIGLQVCGTE